MSVSTRIIQFMRIALSKPVIVSSWGISNIEILGKTLKFDVYGFKFQGRIAIEDKGEYFLIVSSNGMSAKCSSETLLLDFLDFYIESDENYERNLLEYIGK